MFKRHYSPKLHTPLWIEVECTTGKNKESKTIKINNNRTGRMSEGKSKYEKKIVGTSFKFSIILYCFLFLLAWHILFTLRVCVRSLFTSKIAIYTYEE